MKVAHVITGLGDGGAEAALYRLCLNSPELSHTVLSLSGPGKYGPLLENAGIRVHCLGLSPRRVSPGRLIKLHSWIRQTNADVLQTWLYHADLLGGLAARLAGIQAVSWGIHSSALTAGSSSTATLLVARICARLSPYVPSRIVCCSERAAKANQNIGYAPSKFRIIPNGYDLDAFRPSLSARARLRATLGIDDDVPLLGMVGRFDPYKDHANLFQALEILQAKGIGFQCALVGAGMVPSNGRVADWLNRTRLGSSVILLGRRDDVPAIMASLDLHILSSAAEAFPNVLNEAMACGTPCVTTDVGDAAVIVAETGWVVPPGHPALLAQAIEDALNSRSDPEAWQRRQEACRQRVAANFSIQRMVASYMEVWDEVRERGAQRG